MTLDKIPSFIATATFVAIAIVVSHEWAYFGVIGPELQSLYTTHDYLTQLIVWIGPAFVFLAVSIGIQIALYRSHNFETKIVAKSKWGKFIEDWFNEILYVLLVTGALLFTDQTRRWTLYMLLALLSLRIAGYVLSYPGFSDFRKSPAGVLTFVIPAAMVVFYGVGRDEAYSDMKDSKTGYELGLKNQYVNRDVKVLRLIEKGAIVFDHTTRSVEFFRTEDIARIVRHAPEWETKSFACRTWGWACGPKTD